VCNATCSPSHRQASGPVINVPSTLLTALDLCKNVSFAVVFGSNGNSYIISMQLDACICTHSSQYRDDDWAEEINRGGGGTAVNAVFRFSVGPGLDSVLSFVISTRPYYFQVFFFLVLCNRLRQVSL